MSFTREREDTAGAEDDVKLVIHNAFKNMAIAISLRCIER